MTKRMERLAQDMVTMYAAMLAVVEYHAMLIEHRVIWKCPEMRALIDYVRSE